jgi:hypothetical protein
MFLDYDGDFHVHRSLPTLVLHDEVVCLLAISARRQSHAACHVDSSSLSNFDQTAGGLLAILVGDGKIGRTGQIETKPLVALSHTGGRIHERG